VEEDPRNTGTRFEFNLRFPGQYYDKETNTHYNGHRDYNPTTGRYIQADPIGLEGGISLYNYANGNPVSRVDPLGLMEISAIRLPSGDHAGEYRFTFTFDCGKVCVRAKRYGGYIPGTKWVRRGMQVGKLLRTSAGLDDVEDYEDRLLCASSEAELEQLFLQKGYSTGKFGGTGLTEAQAREFMGEAGKTLSNDVREKYNWGNLIDVAKERSTGLR
jgi:RHS repeat-associated protein